MVNGLEIRKKDDVSGSGRSKDGERTGKVEIRTRTKFLVVGEVIMDVFLKITETTKVFIYRYLPNTYLLGGTQYIFIAHSPPPPKKKSARAHTHAHTKNNNPRRVENCSI